MYELIPLTKTDEGVQAVTGRHLHEFLGIGRDYTNWFKDMADYGFTAGQDFTPISAKTSAAGGRPKVDHVVTLDMAKEISMIQRNAKGKQARQYFIEVDKQYRAGPTVDGSEITRMELIQIAMNAETERLALQEKTKVLEPKADAYDSFLDATGKYSVNAVGKMLGIGQNKLFRELRNNGVFIASGSRKNTPYQKYMHHFEVLPHEFEKKNGEQGCSYTTYVQPSGIDFIRRKLGFTQIDPPAPAQTTLEVEQ